MVAVASRIGLAIAWTLASLSTFAAASDATVTQIPTDARAVTCLECSAETLEESELFVAVPQGPADTHDIVQVGDGNVAIGLSIGEGNYIGQFQFGTGNHSAVGLIADQSSVTVVQNGDNLESNLLIWGNPGGPIGIYQPPNSPPVNAAIFTADDGTQVILPGNATTIIRQ